MARDAAWNEADAKAIIDAGAPQKGAMLPILHALQDRFGYIDDKAIPMITDALTAEQIEMVSQSVPVKRTAEPEEVTNLVLFLASDEASFITATEHIIDGGVTSQ